MRYFLSLENMNLDSFIATKITKSFPAVVAARIAETMEIHFLATKRFGRYNKKPRSGNGTGERALENLDSICFAIMQ